MPEETNMKAIVELAEIHLLWLDDHCAARALHADVYRGLEDVESQDAINAMLLGAFKAAGFGKRKRRGK